MTQPTATTATQRPALKVVEVIGAVVEAYDKDCGDDVILWTGYGRAIVRFDREVTRDDLERECNYYGRAGWFSAPAMDAALREAGVGTDDTPFYNVSSVSGCEARVDYKHAYDWRLADKHWGDCSRLSR